MKNTTNTKITEISDKDLLEKVGSTSYYTTEFHEVLSELMLRFEIFSEDKNVRL